MHRFAMLTALATFFLLIAGGMVTSTNSGLAVPDWPLSYGMWFPPMVGGIFYEHGHRMVAAVVGLLILALAVGLGRGEPRRWVRRLGYAALGAVVLQALLGGMTVLWLLPPQLSIAHACLGQLVCCLVVSLAWCTAPQRPQAARQFGADARGHSVTVAAAAFLQLLLGAVIRHTGAAVVPHLLGAAALLALAIALAWRVRRDPALRPDGWRLLGLLIVQGGLGLAVLGHRAHPILRTSHVAVGALVLAQTVVLAWESFRWAPTPTAPQHRGQKGRWLMWGRAGAAEDPASMAPS
ncbi:MAG: COX15/CtaA family protein [Candidatus Omnitrophica bacterium]|nr:COX15/CtaA family protein [Candidatus Omnitrophota bacterium]